MNARKGLMYFILCVWALGCSPDVEVYAPEREIYIVYGVLNPQAAVQYVTVTKVFQYKGDAYAYAATNDLTARGMRVRLRSDNTYWESQLVDIHDTVPQLFSSTTGAYRFETAGAQALQAGKRYDLEITKIDDPDFRITAYTEIPTAPVLTFPGPPSYSIPLDIYTFPQLDFTEEQSIYFKRGTGSGFEIRVYMQYETDHVTHVSHWGPTPIFKNPVGCNVDIHGGCYTIPGHSISNVFHSLLSAYPDSVSFIDTLRIARSVDSLDKTAWVEVTAVDSFLTTYLIANSPFGFGLNLLMDKIEYSNISGDNAGIFGAINMHRRYIFLDVCTKYLSGLKGGDPGNCIP